MNQIIVFNKTFKSETAMFTNSELIITLKDISSSQCFLKTQNVGLVNSEKHKY